MFIMAGIILFTFWLEMYLLQTFYRHADCIILDKQNPMWPMCCKLSLKL